jgi:parallel beta-helix repeat protein
MKNIVKLGYPGIVVIMLVAATSVHAGTVYYVNGANGNDSNPGIATVPWKTIQKAANNMVAGDGVVVAAGSYPERVVISRSGTVGSEISYTASGLVECRGFTVRGDYILVKGFKVTAPQATYADQGYGIWVEGKACRVEDNYAYYSPRGGINLRPNSSACVVRNNRCHRNGMEGMEIHGTGNLIENNDIWGSISYHTPTGAVGDADGIRFFGTGHVFRGNYIHDISYQDPENVGYAPHIDGFQTWEDTYHAAASNIVLERNRIVLPVYKDGAAKGHAFMLHNCGYLMIRNNLVIAHNGTNTDGAATGGATHHLTIVGNTFVGRLAFLVSYWPVGVGLKNCPDSVVRNNIIYDQAYAAFQLDSLTLTSLSISNNCVYNSDRSTPRGSQQPYDLWNQDPLFNGPGASDYHLQPGSPCIDAGMSIAGLTDDFDGLPRPAGRAYDIGACEYQAKASGEAPSIIAQPASLTVSSGQTATLSVTVTGTAPLTYQWYRGTSGNAADPIAGASSSSYTTPSLVQSASYWVRVANGFGHQDSATAVITVTAAVTLPTVTTSAVSSVTATGGTAGGSVSADGGAEVTARGACWGLTANPTTSGTRTSDGSGTGTYTSSMAGLTPMTAYHVRAYATNSVGTAYGGDISFTTAGVVTLPSIMTTIVSSMTSTSAITGGTVSSDGGATVTARGVCWDLTTNPSLSGPHTSDGSGTGSYTSALTGLSSDTAYHVRAYATNSSGTAYGSDIAFTTPQGTTLASVTTATASSITATGAAGGGNVISNGGATVTARGVCWGLTTDPSLSGSHSSDGSGTGSFTSALTSLSPNTTYHVRAYAVNSYGTAYGSDVTFATTAQQTFAIPFSESFPGPIMPSGWTIQNEGNGIVDKWTMSETAMAGGYPNEVHYSWQEVANGTSRLLTPAIDTTGLSILYMNFRHALGTFEAGGVTIKVQTSPDGTTWTDETWSVLTSSADIGPETVCTTLTQNLNRPTTYVALTITGNLHEFDVWDLDDLAITATPPGTLQAPSLSSPRNGASKQPTIIKLSWKDTNNSPSEAGFRVRIRPEEGVYTYYDTVRDARSFLMTGLSTNKRYYWNTMALGDNKGTVDSTWSNSGKDRQFTTGTKATLLPPILAGPVSDAPVPAAGIVPVLTTSPVFRWQDTNSDPQEVGYEVRIKQAGGKYVIHSAGPNAVEFLAANLKKKTTYHWNIRAKGDKKTTLNSSWANSGRDGAFQTGE